MQHRAAQPAPCLLPTRWAAELPTYDVKSSHLKGRDLELLSRTAAEILHV